ncbi:hypothetical protein HY734_00215 [Candidatus Uhrbacteria bacterium]|nr:hypothetical protein [Candidatus Uhrbacteria bacterium]
MAIEFFLVAVLAALASLAFSKLVLGEWWYSTLSWRHVGMLFGVLLVVFETAYFVFLKG